MKNLVGWHFKQAQISTIKELYLSGMSAQEIKDKLNLPQTVRSIQRQVKKFGLSRSVGESYRNAISRGRVKWAYKENKKFRTRLNPSLRFKILERDNYKCVLCGATAENSNLEIDHINNNPSDNREENLRTLCHDCNFGKPRD